MRWKTILSGVICLWLAAGCSDFFMICALNPFYLEKDVTLVPEIEGNWSVQPLKRMEKKGEDRNPGIWKMVDSTAIWNISRRNSTETLKNKMGKDSVVTKQLNSYQVELATLGADSLKYHFKMVLFTVNRSLYADFMPLDYTGLAKSRMAIESYLRIHTLARVDFQQGHPRFSWLGAEYVKEMIETKRVRISYKWVDDAKRLVLTADSEHLTGMLARYAGETRFIDWQNQEAMLLLNRKN